MSTLDDEYKATGKSDVYEFDSRYAYMHWRYL